MTLKHDSCPAIEMIGLSVFRRYLPVLSDIDLTVQQGEILAIMGSNGAGKSTLLECASGTTCSNSVQLRWFGNSNRRSPMLRQQIGFMGHECGLYSDLTSLENLIFASRMYRVKRPEDWAMKYLTSSRLEWFAHSKVRKLSRGVRRRLAIARALVHEPALILLDEPFESLDADGHAWLEGLFREWRDKGRTVCFVSHDVGQSRCLADRILWLNCGRIEALEATETAATRRSA
jgi:ABC-type multidrug transport system ATPase subunit